MACRGLCRCCGCFIAVLLAFFGALSIPFVRSLWAELLFKHLAPTEVPAGPGLLVLTLLGNIPYMRKLGPVRALDKPIYETSDSYTILANAFNGDGVHLSPSNLEVGAMTLNRVSHEANKAFYYDPNGPREVSLADIAPLSNLSDPSTMAFFEEGSIPFALHLSTNDPRWWQMRDLWTATIPALNRRPPHVPDFKLPPFPGVESKFCRLVESFDGDRWSGLFWYGDPAAWVPHELDYVFKFNFFQQVFGVDLTEQEISAIREWFGFVPGLNSGCNDACATRGLEKQKVWMDAVLRGEWSQGFMREAEKRGLDGLKQLRSLVTAFIIAGSGSPGCLSAAWNVLDYIKKDSKLVSVYEQDPEAFILEVIRLHHGGGTGASFWTEKETTFTLGNGAVVKEKKGASAIAMLWASGHDPNVWGGPSKDQAHASEFRPGRENRERLISFMSELGDIRKCPNMTGCTAAPRFCPGAELCPRLSRQLTDFWLEKCKKVSATRDEM
eukprot:TRINITY_DN93420_c0_g1_i1.p1 TRINITY_DN93420_c0_g1~~TRINITY_DN93420_c0_g1_i1.p1  ORF type:complete len:497 (-),score=53.01 TRINITY_DN93420_c0_g1_i1:46-1536(-)